GVYIWLDLHVGRRFTEADNVPGFEDMQSRYRGGKGFTYVNARLRQLMMNFNERYLTHVNAYTGLAYKDEPAIMAMLLTNENNVTHHFGNRMLPDKDVPHHQALFDAAVRDFSKKTGLSS